MLLYYMQHWTRLNVSGAKPSARSSPAVCCIAGPLMGQQNSVIMVIGGRDVNRRNLCDVWLLDVENRLWSEVGLAYIYIYIYELTVGKC